jgi:hypothetical protein
MLIPTSPLLIFLTQNWALESPDAPPRLSCLSSFLVNASIPQLRALPMVYHADAFPNPILECAPLIPGHLKLPYLLVLARVAWIYEAIFADAFQAVTDFLNLQPDSETRQETKLRI